MKLIDLHHSQGRHLAISLWTYHVIRHVLFSMYANLSVACKWVTEHVIMLTEIFDKQDRIF